MDANALSEVMGGTLPLSRYEQLLPAFNQAMIQAGITTPLRAAHWCSQLGHESGGLKWMEEIADGSAYNGRTDLGNTRPGDGPRFKGRGPIQVTGRYNYTNVSKWAHSKGLVPTATYFVDNPKELASDTYGFIGPVWYWTVARANLNTLCDADNVVGVTKAINGGTNGLADRMTRLKKAKAMGGRLLPGETMSYYDVDWSDKFGFGSSRDASALKRVVIHTTENTAGTPAENVANYQITSESGSYHVLVDTTGKRLRENTDDWVTWSTGNDAGNRYGLNLSFVAQAGWTRAQWLAQDKMLRAGATVVRYWCDTHNIPMTQVDGKSRGICGHGDLRIYGGTDHTDPGGNFPWDVFIGYVKNTTITTDTSAGSSTTTTEDTNVLTIVNNLKKLADFIIDQLAGPERTAAGLPKFTGWIQLGGKTLVDAIADIRSDVKEILTLLKEQK